MRLDVIGIALWCTVPALLIAVVLLIRQIHVTALLRNRITGVETELRARDEEVAHLVNNRLPALTDAASDPAVEVVGPLHPELAAEGRFGVGLEAVADRFADVTSGVTRRADNSAKATIKSMMRTVQSLANEQQLAISNMQDRHDDPYVLEDLLRIDHMNSQLGRRAQAAAVLGGSWPGQQRAASPLTDVVRGATSRIRDYLRVQVNTQLETAVVSRAVEPTVLTVAELLDNAARHSQPNTSVDVNFQSGHNGVAIMIDDAGVGMNLDELRGAEAFLHGRETVDINRLGDPPQVGFPVIGVLAARYGFSVSVDTRSPYGGVRAVVFLPNELLTRVDSSTTREPSPARSSAAGPSASQPAPASPQSTAARSTAAAQPSTAGPADSFPISEPVSAPEPATPEPAPSAATGAGTPNDADEPVETHGVTTSGLPKRRRRQRVADQSPTEETGTRANAPGFPSMAPSKLGAWQRGTLSGRGIPSPEEKGSPE